MTEFRYPLYNVHYLYESPIFCHSSSKLSLFIKARLFFTSFVEVQSSECFLSLSVSERSLLINVTPYCDTPAPAPTLIGESHKHLTQIFSNLDQTRIDE